MSLTTPEKIRTLQRKLYAKAKAEPSYRFYLLYDKVNRADILAHAYALAKANAGAPGVDGSRSIRSRRRGSRSGWPGSLGSFGARCTGRNGASRSDPEARRR